MEERLGEFAAERSIPFYNLNRALRQESAPEGIFMDWEFHYDKDGHDWLAKKLLEYVKIEINE